MAERVVGTVKRLLQNASDPHDIPQSNAQLTPHWPYLEDFRKADKEFKTKQEFYFNSRHRTRPLSSLIADDPVWVRMGDRQVPGRVIRPSTAPRSYIVSTPTGQVRRNRHHLTPRLEAYQDVDIDIDLETSTPPSDCRLEEPSVQSPPRSPIRTHSQTGTVIRPPSRFT